MDAQTQILTRRGWLSWDEVEVGDETLSVDPLSGQSRWAKISYVHTAPFVGELNRIKSTSHESLSTDNHRWIIRHLKRGLEFVKTPELKNSNQRLLRSAVRSDAPTDKSYSDEFVELVAWYWTEGTRFPHDGVAIYQSETVNPAKTQRIRVMLNALYGPSGNCRESGSPFLWSENERKSSPGVIRFQLRKKVCGDLLSVVEGQGKYVSYDFLNKLTVDQLRLFIDVSILADGSNHKGTLRFSQQDYERTRIFEYACALAGIATRTRFRDGLRNKLSTKGIWEVTLIKSHGLALQNTSQTKVPYNGIVWCPTVDETSNWLARRDGCVFFTGNSQIVDPDDPAGGLERQVLGGGEEDGWELALLPRGYSWEESGKRFVAFGGAPSIDFEMRREGRDWWKEEMIRDSDLERLHRSAGADVMICHDAPDGGTRAVQRIIDTPWDQSMWSPVGLNYAALGRALMNQAVEIVKPKMFFHGHYHVADERYDEDTDQTWVSLGADGEVHNVVVLDLGRMRVGWLSTH